jgi:hypothetical protein
MESAKNITQLPPEIICYIGDFLGMQRIFFAYTCKKIYYTLKSDIQKDKKKLESLKNNKYITYRSEVKVFGNIYLRFNISLSSFNIITRDLSVDDHIFIKNHLRNYFNDCKAICLLNVHIDNYEVKSCSINKNNCRELLVELLRYFQCSDCNYCKSFTEYIFNKIDMWYELKIDNLIDEIVEFLYYKFEEKLEKKKCTCFVKLNQLVEK